MTAHIEGLPRVRPIVQLGAGDSRTHETAALWDTDLWDQATAKWSGLEPYWVDVTCDIHDIETFTGHERTTETWEIGTAQVVLDNRSGWADYPRVDVEDFYLPVRPGIQIRVGVAVDEVEHWKWRGFIDEANPGLDPLLGETVTLVCIDAKGEAGRGQLAKVDPPVGASEFVHQRIGRILDLQMWPAEWRNLEAAGIRVVAAEFGQSAVDAMNRASDSGGGVVYGDIDGKIRYRNYGWQMYAADEPTFAAIGNVETPRYIELPLDEDPDGSGLLVPPEGTSETAPGLFTVPGPLDEDPDNWDLYRRVQMVEPGDVCPTAWELSFARADFSNRVIVGRADMAEPLTYDDVNDIAAYGGVEPFTLTDLQTELPAELTNLANRILRARNFALAPRIAAVSLNAATGDNVINLMALADPRTPTRVICRHRGTNGRMVFNKVCFVTGVRHVITPTSWEARLSLDDASPWRIGANVGEWDVAKWNEDDWAPTPAPI